MRLLRRLAYWLRIRSHHADLMDEVAFHRGMIERDMIARGFSPADARAHARRAMGNETAMREASRAVWLWPSLEAMWQDVSYTLRNLRRNPAFAVGVIATLALGIGANASMFSLVDRLLFRPPAHLIQPELVHRVYLYRTARGIEQERSGSYARFADLARWSETSSIVAAYSLKSLGLGVGQDTRTVNVAVVSAGFFHFFNAPPVVGRYFTEAEDNPGSPTAVAVLSHATWQTHFGSRPDVLGSVVQIDAVRYTIIGIAPDDFVGLWPYQPPAAWIPVTSYAASEGPPNWATTYGHAIGLGTLAKRKPGISVAAASADFTRALRRSYEQQGTTREAMTTLRPRAVVASVLAERGPQSTFVARATTWLSGVTLIVLLIACANVANLLLSRAIQRRREIAVRIALGVSRARLFGQLLIEGIVLAVLGGAVGVVLALWGSRALSAAFLPGAEHIAVLTDARTLLFAASVTLGVSVFTALIPLALITRRNLSGDLKTGARSGVHQRTALRTTLLLVQAALSVVLLVGAGLFVRSLRKVRDVPIGFDARAVVDVSLEMRDVQLDSSGRVALLQRLIDAAAAMPEVAHVALHESTPFAGMSSWPIFVDGIDSTNALGDFTFNAVSANYFATMGTRILRGRGIERRDISGAPRVAVVGEKMATALWPGQDAIGRCFRVGLKPDGVPCTYVVGIAADIHSQSIEPEDRLFYYYMSADQWRPETGSLFVRARNGDASTILNAVRRRLQREMPGTSYVTARSMGNIVDATMRSWIVGATVFTAFGVLALVLAAVGLYSVIAYTVAQRTHELGVRMALGAARASIVWLVVVGSLRLAVVGIVIGSVAALLAAPWIESLLFHESARDPAVFGVVSIVLVAVAMAASWIPALRAAGVDPKAALQSD